MLLKEEKVKKYVSVGEEVDGYVYRKDSGELWYVVLKDDSKPYFNSRLIGAKLYNCSYFVHKSLEEAEYFLKCLLKIEEYLIEQEYPFLNIISLYWNPITDFLLFDTKDISDSDLKIYVDKIIRNWNTRVEKYKKEFDALVAKKREKWDEYTIWDDDKLYEFEKLYNFEIPEDVKKSKNSVMLDSMIETTQKMIDILDKKNEE